MNETYRRSMAALTVTVLIGLVICDNWDPSIQFWWEHHTFTAAVVSSLLLLAVTGLVVDEVVARRQRQDRSLSVAVQSIIVFGQARRVRDAVVARDSEQSSSEDSHREVQTLAEMLLTASANLFDDPVSRRFLEEVHRFSFSIYRVASEATQSSLTDEDREMVKTSLSQVQTAVEPLVARIPAEYRSLLEGPSQEN